MNSILGTSEYRYQGRRVFLAIEKTLIAILVLVFAFISHVFALQAEAPKQLEGEETGTVLVAEPFSLRELARAEEERKEKEQFEERARKVRAYFHRYHLPMEAYATDFVRSADRYGIDWRLLPAISFIESTGGKFACPGESHNAFGWASCKVHFTSYPEAIDHISRHLAGKDPATARYYRGKDIRGILEAYNPPTIVPDYADKVMREMERMARM